RLDRGHGRAWQDLHDPLERGRRPKGRPRARGEIESTMRRLAVLLVTTCVSVASLPGQGRPMTVEDLFTLSELDDVALAPDGEWTAATITRPGGPNGCPTCPYKETGDVWLVNARTGERRNVTSGAADGSSSWLPTWSPDGRRLAFASTKGEAAEPRNIRLWV